MREIRCKCGRLLAVEGADGSVQVRHRGLSLRAISISDLTCPRCRATNLSSVGPSETVVPEALEGSNTVALKENSGRCEKPKSSS